MAYAMRNHGMSFHGIFSSYLASHPRNYSVDFIPCEKENYVLYNCGFQNGVQAGYTAQLGEKFSGQKINIQRHATTLRATKLFALKLASSRHVSIEKRSTNPLLYPPKRHSRWCKVSHARRETLRNTARW